MELPTPKWLIEGLITGGSRNMLFGDYHVGKSRLALGMAIAVARGEKFLDKYQCNEGKVVFLENDMPDHDWQNIARLARNRYPKLCSPNIHQAYYEANFHIIQTVELLNSGKSVEWADVVYEQEPDLLIVDSFNNSFTEEAEKPHIMKRIVFAWREFLSMLPFSVTALYIVQETKSHKDRSDRHAYSGAYTLPQDLTCMLRLWEKHDNADEKHVTVVKARGLPKQDTINVSLDEDSVLFYNLGVDNAVKMIEGLLAAGIEKHIIKETVMREFDLSDDTGAFGKKWKKATGKTFREWGPE